MLYLLFLVSKWLFCTYTPSLFIVFISLSTFSVGFYLLEHSKHSGFRLCPVIPCVELVPKGLFLFAFSNGVLSLHMSGFLGSVLGIVLEHLFVAILGDLG